MVSLRYLVWLLISILTFCLALVVFVVSRQIPSLDHGWVNGVLVFGIWLGTVAGFKRTLMDDWSSRSITSIAAPRMSATTLEYRRR